MTPAFSIGIEEEYQTIDPVTRELRSHIDAEIISKGKTRLAEAVKAEAEAVRLQAAAETIDGIYRLLHPR